MSDTRSDDGRHPSAALLAAAVAPPGHSARIVDAVLMALLVVRITPSALAVPAPLSDLPVAQLAIAVLVVVSVFRRPRRSLRLVWWYPLLCIALLGSLMAASLLGGTSFAQRIGNIALLLTMAGFLGSGRIDVASALKGIAAALGINAVLFYLGLAPDEYGGFLSGFLEDKNAAALVYGIGALLVSLTMHQVWARVAVLIAGGVAVVLTDSRTSMAAYGAGLIWLSVSPRLGLAFRAGIAAALWAAFLWADQNLSEIGRYAIDRVGSDALRERIDAAARVKTEVAPWYGSGLGEARVPLEGTDWFYHNSYDALWTEGGVIAVAVVLAIYLGAGFGLFSRRDTTYPWHTAGAATLMLLMCATRLGEVFFAPIGLVVVGTGLALITARDPYSQGDGAWRVRGYERVA